MKKRKLRIKRVLLLLLLLVVIAISGTLVYYKTTLDGVSNSSVDKEIVIQKGSSSKEIAKTLKKHSLIKNEFTFLVYIKLNKVSDLKYGTYLMKENMGVEKVVEMLKEGSNYNPDEVTITFQEGINMREIATIISKNTTNSYEDVIAKSNDSAYIKKLKEKYWFITDSLDNSSLYYKLEGYLYPDTYKLTNKEVSVEYIFEKMLDEMEKHLKEYKNFDYSHMTIHEYLSLASMVEKESPVAGDRSKMAAVFLNRKAKGMNLGSDVTARYANKIDDKSKALTAMEFALKSPYNTRVQDGSMNGRLPIGPISTVSKASIDAAFKPDNHNYLYFISNIVTQETFFYEKYSDFLVKKEELKEVNQGF